MYSPLEGRDSAVPTSNVGGEKSQLDKQITALLGKLQTDWICDTMSAEKVEGTLYKRQRKHPHKWRLYRFVLSGNSLCYYSDQKSKRKPRGILSISFATPKIPTTEQQLLEISQSEVSKNYFLVFSHNRMDTIAAPDDAELIKFHSAIERVIKENLREQEIQQRNAYVQELIPLLAQKTSQEIERILAMIAELEHTGFGTGKAKRDKTGNLFMLEENEGSEPVWTKYYFVLQNQCLYYYKNSKSPPKGMVTLKFTMIDVENSTEFTFRLSTPISTFLLKAKHAVAMEEWLNMLNTSKAGKKKDKGETESRSLLSGDGFTELDKMGDLDVSESFGYHKKVVPQLIYEHTDGRTKTLKIPLGNTVIGRSDSCNITLEDKQISRSHCKIEVTEHSAILVDLGSGHGTKVNRKKVDKVVLRPGDTIKIGKTKLKFEVAKK